MAIRPLGSRVLVQPPAVEEMTESGFYLPTTRVVERPQRGIVVALGPDCRGVKVGETVEYKKYSPDEIQEHGILFFILDEKDIICVME